MDAMIVKELKKKIAEKRTEKEEKRAARYYQIITEENGNIKTIDHPISSFGGGTFIKYYGGSANSLGKPKR